MSKTTETLKGLRLTRERVQAEINGNAKDGGLYGAGFSSEGFAGGYRAALDDVELMLTAGIPNNNSRYWRRAPPRS